MVIKIYKKYKKSYRTNRIKYIFLVVNLNNVDTYKSYINNTRLKIVRCIYNHVG